MELLFHYSGGPIQPDMLVMSYLSTQHMSSRCCGTCAGLRRAGQSERKHARKALVLLERSSLARPNHRRRRLGQVHSRKQRAGTSSGVRADLDFPLLHSLTITGGTVTHGREKGRRCAAVGNHPNKRVFSKLRETTHLVDQG